MSVPFESKQMWFVWRGDIGVYGPMMDQWYRSSPKHMPKVMAKEREDALQGRKTSKRAKTVNKQVWIF